ncbi:MAG TPA: BTAD domain-containing putative transcriptional regulator [Candidatus Dormibacteraeota bacterium]|nr:BTAD domain-containing putative transcriptional regulator [Candidatus Dormibacteraeota bacterium]
MDFGLLGPVEAHHDGRRVDLGRRRERCLLGLLLLEAGRHVSIDRLVDLLWTDDPPAGARAAVHTSVARLRARLAPHGIRLASGAGGYAADIDPQRVDVHRFSRQVAAAEAMADPAARAGVLREALGLWRGPLLSDVADDRVRARVGMALEERRLVATERLAEADLEAGRPDQAIAGVVGVLEQDPARERLAALLMTALYRSGRAADALAVYRRTEAFLTDELGLEPGAELRRVRELIQRGDPDLAAPAPPDTPDAPGADVSHGRRYLPADAPHFTGREDDLWLLDRLVADATGLAVVVVAGTAGVGKTALAVRWAHSAADRFPDGQLYLNLRGCEPGFTTRPLDALSQLLRALGVPERTIPADQEEAAALYRSLLADRRVLVLLDNAGDAEQVRPLLPAGSGSLVLITSRHRLSGLVARDGATRLDLDVLPLSEAVALLGRVVGSRIAAEPDAAARLAEACARLPLALRIAAAHLADRPRLSLSGYVQRLQPGDRLAALEIDDDGQASVRAAFALSYGRLDSGAARLFRLLGLVPGADITSPAAAALAGTSPTEARRLLDRLHGACLVERPGSDRYAYHDLLRLYAQELADADGAGERRQAVECLETWYLEWALAAAAALYPQLVRLPDPQPAEPPARFAQPAEALAWLDEEWPNLLALVAAAAERGSPAAWRLADALRGYQFLGRRLADWPAVGTAALRTAEAAGSAAGRAAAHLGMGNWHYLAHRYRDAVEHLEQALAAAREAGWVAGQAAIVGTLSAVHRYLGRFRASRQLLEEALALARGSGWTDGEATALGNLGFLYAVTGPLPTAVAYLTQAIDLHRRRGHPKAAAMFVGALADAHRALGRLDEAYGGLEEALGLLRSIGDRAGEAVAFTVLAQTHRQAGRTAEALASAAEAAAIGREVEDRGIRIDACNALGVAHLAAGDLAAAAEHHRQALVLAREGGTAPTEAEALLGLAAVERQAGRHAAGEANADAALSLARETGSRLLEGEALCALAEAALARDAVEEAAALAAEALDVHEETGHFFGRREARRLLESSSSAAARIWQGRGKTGP